MSKECPAKSGKPLSDMTVSEIRACMSRSLPALGAQMGSSYRDAVELCLSGNLEPRFGDANTANEKVVRAFFIRVLKRLSNARV